MKKAIIFTLTALLLISSMTACGSKDKTEGDNPVQSRVLYSDDETDENEEAEEGDEAADEAKEDADTTSAANEESSSASKKKVTSSKKSVTTTSSSAANSSTTSGAIRSKRTATTSSTASVRSSSSSAVTSSQTSSATITVMPSQNNVSARTPTGAGVSTGGNHEETPPAESSKLPDSDVKTTDTDTAADTDITIDTDTDTESVELPVVMVGSFDESDLTASFAGGAVNFGDDIEDVKNILGEPIDTQSAPSCKYSGQLDKTFVFSDCSINTYPNEDGSKDYVVGIVINSDGFTTAKGAKIGTTADELIAMYGYSTSDDSPTRKYVLGDKTLSFYLENDVVAEINYIWNN